MTRDRFPKSGSGVDPGADDEIEILEIVGLDEDVPPIGGIDDEVDHAVDEAVVFEAAVAQPKASREDDRVDRVRFQRLQADFENFKKRVERERDQARITASAHLVKRMLPVLDNFERAISAAPQDDEHRKFLDGVALIFRQLLDELRKEGLVAIETLGQPFDPTVHEAVATDTTTGLPSHTIVEEVERGYLLRDRLLRPAKVRVAIDPNDMDDVAAYPEEG